MGSSDEDGASIVNAVLAIFGVPILVAILATLCLGHVPTLNLYSLNLSSDW
jgi:hypothetical protein